jgi:hypothetical protein
MGSYVPIRAKLPVLQFTTREKWEFMHDHRELANKIDPNTPMFYDTLGNVYSVGLPTNLELAYLVISSLVELHEKEFMKMFGIPNYPPSGSLVKDATTPSSFVKLLYKYVPYTAIPSTHIEEEIDADTHALKRIEIELRYL